MRSANSARTRASSRSVLASRLASGACRRRLLWRRISCFRQPMARAKSRIWRGLTTAAAMPARPRAATRARSSPPPPGRSRPGSCGDGAAAAAGQPGHQAADAGGGVGEAGAGTFWQQMHVELPFADVDAAEAGKSCEAHGQAILVSGLAARSTIRFTDKVRTGAALTRDLPRPRTNRRPVRRPCPDSHRNPPVSEDTRAAGSARAARGATAPGVGGNGPC